MFTFLIFDKKVAKNPILKKSSNLQWQVRIMEKIPKIALTLFLAGIYQNPKLGKWWWFWVFLLLICAFTKNCKKKSKISVKLFFLLFYLLLWHFIFRGTSSIYIYPLPAKQWITLLAAQRGLILGLGVFLNIFVIQFSFSLHFLCILFSCISYFYDFKLGSLAIECLDTPIWWADFMWISRSFSHGFMFSQTLHFLCWVEICPSSCTLSKNFRTQ